jgi:hypothetical protein
VKQETHQLIYGVRSMGKRQQQQQQKQQQQHVTNAISVSPVKYRLHTQTRGGPAMTTHGSLDPTNKKSLNQNHPSIRQIMQIFLTKLPSK